MFGGLEQPEPNCDTSKIVPKCDLYALRIVNNTTVEWTLKQCSGEVPMPRAYHTACKVQEDKIFIFGGCYTSNLRYNDCFFLKLRTKLFKYSELPMESTSQSKINRNPKERYVKDRRT